MSVSMMIDMVLFYIKR